METTITITLIVLLLLSLWLLWKGIIGAIVLFGWAVDSGGFVVGLNVYIAAWVFLFPFMAVISIIAGIVAKYWSDEEEPSSN